MYNQPQPFTHCFDQPVCRPSGHLADICLRFYANLPNQAEDWTVNRQITQLRPPGPADQRLDLISIVGGEAVHHDVALSQGVDQRLLEIRLESHRVGDPAECQAAADAIEADRCGERHGFPWWLQGDWRPALAKQIYSKATLMNDRWPISSRAPCGGYYGGSRSLGTRFGCSIFERAGTSVLPLPPSSPDFHPIEEMFSKFQEFLRRIGARAKEHLYDAIGEGLREVTSEDTLGWFRHAGMCVMRA
jgi:hypothetical protein